MMVEKHMGEWSWFSNLLIVRLLWSWIELFYVEVYSDIINLKDFRLLYNYGCGRSSEYWIGENLYVDDVRILTNMNIA